MQGILLVDKPAGWTSFDVVNYVRHCVATREGKKPKNIKVGHAGTLDPFATGLLILLVGKENTRRANEYSKLDKSYAVTMRLGEISSTGDPEGQISHVNGPKPTREELETAVRSFIGEIDQTPPAFSAIKIGGQRAYKLARAGHEVTIEPRKVSINRLQITEYEYPIVKFVADVSSGTYIRSLVEDLGRTLGSSAYTAALCRLTVGDYKLADAHTIDELKGLLSAE